MSSGTLLKCVRRRSPKGFTLVELLVVIGIIAVLIGVLLPALSGARRSAQQVKCAAALQEIGLGFTMYANEMKGYYPPTKFDTKDYAAANGVTFYPNGNYVLNDETFIPGGTFDAYWQNFVAPYVAAASIGNSQNGAAAQVTQTKKTVLWGCPAWEQYQNGSAYSIQTGYGMNPFPTYVGDQDPAYEPKMNLETALCLNGQNGCGRFFKQIEYTRPAERVLVGDSTFWLIESEAPGAAPYSQAIAKNGQAVEYGASANIFTDVDQTLIDIYRHGRKPNTVGSNYAPNGGKIAYNLMFCDGHVGEFSDAQMAYQGVRMKFP